MIGLEGRVLAGLDEFMLRLGHLTVLCQAACEAGASWHRIEKEARAQLTREVSIPSDLMTEMARYLERKRLCVVIKNGTKAPSERERERYRYPKLAVQVDDDASRLVRLDNAEAVPLEVWWQDYCLASEGVPSRVGAVTAVGKSGSKTGLSHVADWSQMLDLVSRSGDILPIGRLVAKLGNARENPYQIGWERIAYAYLVLSADFDVFARYLPKLARAPTPIRKADGTKLFVHTMEEIASEARECRTLSTRGKQAIFAVFRDLETAARRSGRRVDETSTGWHRASSRLETYTDLGFLEKGRRGEVERYEYAYYPTERVFRIVASFEEVGTVRDWLEKQLVSMFFEGGETTDEPDPGDLVPMVPEVVATLARPAAPLPLEALSIGLAWLSAERGRGRSLESCRRTLEELAIQRPDIARLSRGGQGDRAEFISLDLRKLEEYGS